LQAEVSACVLELANVLFCALAVHYLVFLSSSISSKLSVRFCLFTLGGNGKAMVRAAVLTSIFTIYKRTKICNTNLVFTSIPGMHYEPMLWVVSIISI